MTDVATKAVLHLAASAGLMQELGNRLAGQETLTGNSDDTLPEAAEQVRQQIGSADQSGSDTDFTGKDQKESFLYTVMISAKSGDSRALSIKASSADEAKKAARSALDEGEEVASVSQSTVPAPPDPNRGLLA